MAGTVAAATNNGIGVAGVAFGAKVMPLRAVGRLGGSIYDIEQAVRFAAGLPNDSGTVPPRRADVINLSLGSTYFDSEDQAVLIWPTPPGWWSLPPLATAPTVRDSIRRPIRACWQSVRWTSTRIWRRIPALALGLTWLRPAAAPPKM